MKIRGFGDTLQINESLYEPDKPLWAIFASNRQTLVDLLDKCKDGFTITMPCGYERRFREYDDIPVDDLPCPCGQEERYLIKYKKE